MNGCTYPEQAHSVGAMRLQDARLKAYQCVLISHKCVCLCVGALALGGVAAVPAVRPQLCLPHRELWRCSACAIHSKHV